MSRKPKVGDIVVITETERDEDFGVSGFALPARSQIVKGAEFKIISIDKSTVPKDIRRFGNISIEDFRDIQLGWWRLLVRDNSFCGYIFYMECKLKNKQ